MNACAHRPKVLKVLVSGGGPVGLIFALQLAELMGDRVEITIHDGRWIPCEGGMKWKSTQQGNARRQQVVTIQSRQIRQFPQAVQAILFALEASCEMWPSTADSINGERPRNVRIAYLEDKLLALVNKQPERIRLVASSFVAGGGENDIKNYHALVIAEGAQSSTRQYYADKFGVSDPTPYSINGVHLQDVVLGLRVKTKQLSAMSVVLTLIQRTWLLNTLNGEGFLNMRLTDDEAAEVTGVDLEKQSFLPCIQSNPCLMERSQSGEYSCAKHGTLFVPALRRDSSQLWARIREGLTLFGIEEQDCSAVTAFRLSMTSRSRFWAELQPSMGDKHGTYGFLLGDAANVIHFWPGRGLNSGAASALSLARCLSRHWKEVGFRDADFVRHQGIMSMLQDRHQARAWRAMVTTDEKTGEPIPIKSEVAAALRSDVEGSSDEAEVHLQTLMSRVKAVSNLLGCRIGKLPHSKEFEVQLKKCSVSTLRAMVASGPWDTANSGGEEVEVDRLLPNIPTEAVEQNVVVASSFRQWLASIWPIDRLLPSRSVVG